MNVKRAEIELADSVELDAIGATFRVWRFQYSSADGDNIGEVWFESDNSFRGRVLNAYERAGGI